MTGTCFCFDRFRLDPADRQLRRDGVPVELNSRYLDALALLVREGGSLVSKDRFMEEVWRGVPVTDEALTQCIRTLRRQLGDDAARPRFIETVPKHGYRFIAPVAWVRDEPDPAPAAPTPIQPASPPVEASPSAARRRVHLVGLAGTAGGGVAGAVGGLFYGFASASEQSGAGPGAASGLLVLLFLTTAVAVVGAAGVSFGIAAGGRGRPGLGMAVGGALGGLLVGAVAKLLGLDAFNLLLGRSPGDITGAPEGALLGLAIGLAAWITIRASAPPRTGAVLAALLGGAAGVLISVTGGRLFGGSLYLLARAFPRSSVRLDQIGGLFGESGLGPVSRAVTSGLEGALFSACIVGAMLIARRNRGDAQPGSNDQPGGR